MTPPAAQLRPVQRSTLATVVTEQIRSAILEGLFPPGSKLQEADLAERFAVSRGPVREGIQRLIQEGLLQSEPHRGVFVPVVTDEDVIDIYFVREAIERAAVTRLIETGDTAAVSTALREVVALMEKAVARSAWPQVAELDLRFHTTLVDGVGSPRLSRAYSARIAETRICLSRLAEVYPARDDLLDEHRQLADLLAGRQLDAILKALAQHFGDAVQSLVPREQAPEPDPH